MTTGLFARDHTIATSVRADDLPVSIERETAAATEARAVRWPARWRRARPLRVALIGSPERPTSPGGGEIQHDALLRALRGLGIDARRGDAGDRDLRALDCLHLIGSRPEYLPLVAAARRRGVPVVLSTIAWFDFPSRWHAAGSWRSRLRGCAGMAGRTVFPRWPDWRRRLYDAVDLLLPNSNAEAAQLGRLLRIPLAKICVVPNGADPRFAAGDARPFVKRFGVHGFVLYAGRIEPRKNQLGFLRALRGINLPVVMLGDVVPGHQAYLARCRRTAGTNVRFIGRLEHDDPLLGSAYAACRCLALTSWFETPGLVALEAGMSGAPLVLTDRGATREYFGPMARYASPHDEAEIRRGVLHAMTRPRSVELARRMQADFTWKRVAEVTLEAYQSATGKP